jgi:hypothetical protein
VSRGRRTQVLVADWFKKAGVFPDASSNPASLAGKDILDTPGYACEVKARREFSPKEWAKQAAKNAADGELPFVVMRPDGLGEESVAQFLAFMTLDRFTWMVNRIQALEVKVNELQYDIDGINEEFDQYLSGHHN